MACKVQASVSLGALASSDVVIANLTALSQDAYVISADLTWSTQGVSINDGPIQCGLAHSDYTVTEIQEAIDASPANDSDMIQIERTRRKVRTVGIFERDGTATGKSLNDGKKMRSKMGWHVSNNKEISIWAQNRDAATLTTGGQVQVTGTLYLVWQ